MKPSLVSTHWSVWPGMLDVTIHDGNGHNITFIWEEMPKSGFDFHLWDQVKISIPTITTRVECWCDTAMRDVKTLWVDGDRRFSRYEDLEWTVAQKVWCKLMDDLLHIDLQGLSEFAEAEAYHTLITIVERLEDTVDESDAP